MNVRPRRSAGDRAPEGDKGNPGLTQIAQQRPALFAIGMKRNIHGIAVVEPQSIVRRRLAERADWQRSTERLNKISFDP